MNIVLSGLARAATSRSPGHEALRDSKGACSYEELEHRLDRFAHALAATGLARSARVALYADKSIDAVVSLFGASRAGGVIVPVNPLLRPEQVGYILRDCNVSVLVTTGPRLKSLLPVLQSCPDLRLAICIGAAPAIEGAPAFGIETLDAMLANDARVALHRVIDADMAAILYTSGSTGNPKGVVLSHRNLVAGAESVASYLENTADDRILVALPLSFDYGLSQVTTAFHVGATAVLHNHLLPAETVRVMARERITGLAGVPPLRRGDADPDAGAAARARAEGLALPDVRPHRGLPLDLPAARRDRPATDLDRQGHPQRGGHGGARRRQRMRGGRAGRARAPGRAGRHGLLERRGAHTRALPARARPAPGAGAARVRGLVGRYRPARRRGFPMLGQVIVVVAKPADGTEPDTAKLLAACKAHLPMYMLPAHVEWSGETLPRNANGKIDRKALSAAHQGRFEDSTGP
jgi:acyl-CoA synthetase (AMP-forming)/AMP-acid ligase II